MNTLPEKLADFLLIEEDDIRMHSQFPVVYADIYDTDGEIYRGVGIERDKDNLYLVEFRMNFVNSDNTLTTHAGEYDYTDIFNVQRIYQETLCDLRTAKCALVEEIG